MAAIRSKNTKIEVAFRSRLHSLGLRFRIHHPDLLGAPDIVFPRARVIVFVDGDYWHARLLREQGLARFQRTLRTASRAYWLGKFTSRVKRDDTITATLRAEGWLVLRYWESDLKIRPDRYAKEVAAYVRRRLRANYRMKLTGRGRRFS